MRRDSQMLSGNISDFSSEMVSKGPWAKRLIDECKAALDVVLPKSKGEREFLDLVLDQGEVQPELLASDAGMAERISTHPAILYKTLNVKKHKGTK